MTRYFLLSGFKSFVEISSRRFSRRMASTAKYAVDDIISFRETSVGEEFLRDFQILDRKQNDIQTAKPVTTLVKSVLNTELAIPRYPRNMTQCSSFPPV